MILTPLKPYLAYAKGAAVLILILLLCSQVEKCTASKYEARIATMEKGYAQAAASQQRHIREWENKKAQEFAILSERNLEDRNNVIAHKDRIIAGLRAGRLRLKACSGLPQAATDTAPAEAGAEGGQLGLVGEAITVRLAVCDEVTHERNMAVRLLEAERQP